MFNIVIESFKSGTTFPFNSFPIIITKKLVGSNNYVQWVVSIELWCMKQGIKNHLTIKSYKTTWIRTNVVLCSMLKNIINTQLQPIFKFYRTCFKIWAQVKHLYTNDIQYLYLVASNLVHLKQQGLSISEFLWWMTSLKTEFNSFLSINKSIVKDLA